MNLDTHIQDRKAASSTHEDYSPLRLTKRGLLLAKVGVATVITLTGSEMTGVTDLNGNTVTCEGQKQYLADSEGLHGVAQEVDAPRSVPTAEIVNAIQLMNPGLDTNKLQSKQQVLGPEHCR